MPKTFKHLYLKIYASDNLYQAFRQARKGGKRKKESMAAFELNLEANLWLDFGQSEIPRSKAEVKMHFQKRGNKRG